MKRRKCYNFNRYFLPVVSLKAIHKGNLSLINIDEGKIFKFQTVNKLKDTGKGIMLVEKRTF